LNARRNERVAAWNFGDESGGGGGGGHISDPQSPSRIATGKIQY